MVTSFLNRFLIPALQLIFLTFCFSCSDPKDNPSSLNYDLPYSTQGVTIVHLREPLDKQIDTAQLNIIADSLFKRRPTLSPENTELSYIVRFYYREDWKGNMCYAIKTWDYHYDEKKFYPSKLEVTGTTGDEKQDKINYNKNVKPVITSFDTAAYLQKVKTLSDKKIHQLIKAQLSGDSTLKPFIKLCKQKLDSANIITDGNDHYSYLYHGRLLNVWANVAYPVTKNNFTYSKIVTFEGCYDLYGNQVYFKQSF